MESVEVLARVIDPASAFERLKVRPHESVLSAARQLDEDPTGFETEVPSSTLKLLRDLADSHFDDIRVVQVIGSPCGLFMLAVVEVGDIIDCENIVVIERATGEARILGLRARVSRPPFPNCVKTALDPPERYYQIQGVRRCAAISPCNDGHVYVVIVYKNKIRAPQIGQIDVDANECQWTCGPRHRFAYADSMQMVSIVPRDRPDTVYIETLSDDGTSFTFTLNTSMNPRIPFACVGMARGNTRACGIQHGPDPSTIIHTGIGCKSICTLVDIVENLKTIFTRTKDEHIPGDCDHPILFLPGFGIASIDPVGRIVIARDYGIMSDQIAKWHVRHPGEVNITADGELFTVTNARLDGIRIGPPEFPEPGWKYSLEPLTKAAATTSTT